MEVLIVEDDKVLSLLLTKMVERMGFDVVRSVSKGVEAVSSAVELSPDLILMDIMLEDDLDGIDAMLQIRKKGLSIPVIFITGNSDPYNRERALETEFVDYLIKPVSYDELQASMNQVKD
ncbi:response regulator [Balneola sp. MJW-20]|uniref:response regulator n=1 Tax=Gracilimonas aurantiaca TaxID=3234185 RepID=UPI003467A2FD